MDELYWSEENKRGVHLARRGDHPSGSLAYLNYQDRRIGTPDGAFAIPDHAVTKEEMKAWLVTMIRMGD